LIFCVATKRVKFKRTRSNLDNSTSSYAVISKKYCQPLLPNRRTTHRLARLDVPVPTTMRAPGARSQLLGEMTMGLSMALHEASVLDPHFGDYVNHDFAEYHIATNADVGTVDVTWIDEDDPHFNPMGAKGVGEIGIVGTAAAIANAVYHATGIRVLDLVLATWVIRSKICRFSSAEDSCRNRRLDQGDGGKESTLGR